MTSNNIPALMPTSATARNSRGEWVPAIPLPYRLAFGRRRCECGRKFLGDEAYRGHYAYRHILGHNQKAAS